MNHPPQREMWEGLSGFGCLGIILIMILVALTIEMFIHYC